MYVKNPLISKWVQTLASIESFLIFHKHSTFFTMFFRHFRRFSSQTHCRRILENEPEYYPSARAYKHEHDKELI